MKKRIHHLILTLLTLTLHLHAQDSPSETATPTSTPSQKTEEDTTRVSILGYHEFTANQPPTEMRLPNDKFRLQMQAIKDLGLNVITLQEFIDWKSGKKSIPDRSILITIDDGWKSVYTDAYPILKEFGFPFTLYLYKNYVDGGGKALTTKMIKEMQANGATIGSHSTSHPYPSTVKKARNKGKAHYAKFLQKEFGDSKTFLERKFKQPITTYVYPGGYHTPEMFDLADELGYKHLFTVLPGKVTRDTEDHIIPRYVILGTHDSIFRSATTFRSTGKHIGTAGAIIQTTPHPVSPEPGGTTTDRLPTITADLTNVPDLLPETATMTISGFGKVPAKFDPETKKLSWKVNRRLRTPTCDVTVQWKTENKKATNIPMRWTFIIDRQASYLPKTSPSLPKPAPSKIDSPESPAPNN